MSGQALAWTGIAGGTVVIGAVALLLERTLRPTREIVAYAEDIGGSISRPAIWRSPCPASPSGSWRARHETARLRG